MATASSLTLRQVPSGARQHKSKSTRRPRAKSVPRTSAYHPYHPKGELVFLTLIGIAGFLWIALPITFYLKLIGSVIWFLVIPASVLQEYWPKLKLHTLGWRSPDHPRNPIWYTAIVTLMGFVPLVLFLMVESPMKFVAVNPGTTWVTWIISQGMVAVMAISQAAFFCGLLLFRLTHLVRPFFAIVIVGFMMALGQMLLPGTLAILALPLSLAFAWIAWQTKSFVPVAIVQLLLSVTYDLLVRISV